MVEFKVVITCDHGGCDEEVEHESPARIHTQSDPDSFGHVVNVDYELHLDSPPDNWSQKIFYGSQFFYCPAHKHSH